MCELRSVKIPGILAMIIVGVAYQTTQNFENLPVNQKQESPR